MASYNGVTYLNIQLHLNKTNSQFMMFIEERLSFSVTSFFQLQCYMVYLLIFSSLIDSHELLIEYVKQMQDPVPSQARYKCGGGGQRAAHTLPLQRLVRD